MEGNPVFLTLENPVIVGAIVFSIILILIYIFSKFFYFPLMKKYFKDKKKNILVSKILFETDPNPLFRIDSSGKLIQKNKSADKLFEKHKLCVKDILHNTGFSFDGFESRQHQLQIDNRCYEITEKHINELEVVQFYLKDKTEVFIKEKLIEDYKKKVSLIRTEQENKFLAEQNEIARELHDSINHNLLFLIKKFHKKNYAEQDIEELTKIFDAIRNCSKNIKPQNFEIDDFSFSVYELSEKIRTETNLEIDISISEDVNELCSDILFHLYRIIQELLSNIIKYADANNVEINIYNDDDMFFLTVEDDGIGFEPQLISENHYTSSGLGLINIQERVNEINASWSIDSEKGKGTITIVEFSGKL